MTPKGKTGRYSSRDVAGNDEKEIKNVEERRQVSHVGFLRRGEVCRPY